MEVDFSKYVFTVLIFFLKGRLCKNLFYFIYVLLTMLGLCCCVCLSLVAESRGYFSLQCVGFSLRWLLSLRSTDSRVLGLQQLGHVGSWALAHRLHSCVQHAGSFHVRD